jgi:hypothetical protein
MCQHGTKYCFTRKRTHEGTECGRQNQQNRERGSKAFSTEGRTDAQERQPAALVPAGKIGRMLSRDEADRLLTKLEARKLGVERPRQPKK